MDSEVQVITRPKIQLVRVSSSEAAKIPINPVQLSLTYQHYRSVTYVKAINDCEHLNLQHLRELHLTSHEQHNSLDDNLLHVVNNTPKHKSKAPRWLPAPLRPAWRHISQAGNGMCRSCDELRKINLIKAASSRSEGCLVGVTLHNSTSNSNAYPRERLVTSEKDLSILTNRTPRPARSTPAMNAQSTTPTAQKLNIVKQKASTLPLAAANAPPPSRKSKGFGRFFRRLSPHLRRACSPPARPWITVEPKDTRASVASDHSFDAALKAQKQSPGYDPSSSPKKEANGHHHKSTFSVTSLLASLRPSRFDKHKRKERNDQKGQNGTQKGHDSMDNDGNLRRDKSIENGFPQSIRTDQISPEARVPATVVPTVPINTPHVTTSSNLSSRNTKLSGQKHGSNSSHSRPHTLNLNGTNQAASTLLTDKKTIASQKLAHLGSPNPAPSIESIGPCSLDVNDTATVSMITMEVGGDSQRSLRSVSLGTSLTAHNTVSPTSPPGVDRSSSTARTPDRPPSLKGFSLSADRKPPSYLGISCAVSGYSHLNRYDSALREGFRSRDNSPARFTFSRSRDSSPMRPDWPRPYDSKTSPQATAIKIRELKQQLAKCAQDLNCDIQRTSRHGSSRRRDSRLPTGRSKSVDRGYLTKVTSPPPENMNGHSISHHVRMVEIKTDNIYGMKSSKSMHNYSYENNYQNEYGRDLNHKHSSNNNNYETDQDTKSFIQQRIERLYGPGALGSAFRTRRSILEKKKQSIFSIKDNLDSKEGRIIPIVRQTSSEEDESVPEGMPSVFRHLRPEFRHQLPVKQQSKIKRENSRDSISPEAPKSQSPVKDGGLSSPSLVKAHTNGNGIHVDTNVDEILSSSHTNGHDSPEVISLCSLSDSVNREILVPIKVSNEALLISNKSDLASPTKVSAEDKRKSSQDDTCRDSTQSINTSSAQNEPAGPSASDIDTQTSSQLNQTKDGHYFLKVVNDEVSNIEEKVKAIERDLEHYESQMTEDVRGKVLAATGKAKLLVSQKVQQFAGLCHKNIAGSQGEEFPTTNDDLAGFWDMVSIQVSVVHSLLAEVDTLRKNDWKEVKNQDTVDAGSSKSPATKSTRAKPNASRAPKQKTAAMKAKDEARKKMIEERRKAMKEAMSKKKDDSDMIFVATDK